MLLILFVLLSLSLTNNLKKIDLYQCFVVNIFERQGLVRHDTRTPYLNCGDDWR